MSKILAHCLDSNTRTEDVTITNSITFESLLLSEKIFKGLTETGFKKPSPIQLKAIPFGRCGFDLIIKSKSGTGKTLVFTVIALEMVDTTSLSLQSVIVAPTREIAVQIQEVMKQIGSYIEGLKIECFIGGLSLADDKKKCKECHIAVGTPGRLKHLIDEDLLVTGCVRLFILDEADKLMEKSFQNDINDIYNSLPRKKQLITTSATYPNELEIFLSRYMLSPTFISTEINTPLLLGLKQFVKVVKPHSNVVQQMRIKNEELINIFSKLSFTQCLVFSNYQTRAESISNILNQKDWHTTYISAAQSQTQRLAALNDLKQFKCRIMLSTDLTARGIDAANVDLVINYDIPLDPMTYLHRMGRAGRFGSSGICINLAFEGTELQHLQDILGSIGGSALSIPILPTFSGTITDLLKMEYPAEACIHGIVCDTTKVNMRQKIIDLKVTKPIADSTKKISESNQINTDVMSILNDNKSEVDMIRKQIADMDSTDILKSLASGDFNIGSSCSNDGMDEKLLLLNHQSDLNNKNNKINVKQVNKSSLFLENLLTSSTEKLNDIKFAEPQILTDSVGSVNDDIKQTEKVQSCSERNTPENNMFYKNNALFNVTKFLDSPSKSTEADTDSIKQYLDLLKNQETQELSKLVTTTDISDILETLHQGDFQSMAEKNLSEQSPPAEEGIEKKNISLTMSVDESVNECDIENVFKLGYESIVKGNGETWKMWLSKIESTSESKHEMHNNENSYVSTVDNSECEVMKWVPVEQSIRETSKNATDNTDCDVTNWLPVEKNEEINIKETCVLEAGTSTDNYEHFSAYFDGCSEQLWQNGLAFEEVASFDDWFTYEWETQVCAIRNYVQQNIYVQEMNKYQNSVNMKYGSGT